MADERRHEAAEWLVFARRDLDVAHALLQSRSGFPQASVFHAQQAAEKAFKAFLVFHERAVARTHNLVALLGRCAEIDPRFLNLVDAATTLTPYATRFRYPLFDEMAEPELLDAVAAVDLATRVVDTVMAAMERNSEK